MSEDIKGSCPLRNGDCKKEKCGWFIVGGQDYGDACSLVVIAAEIMRLREKI